MHRTALVLLAALAACSDPSALQGLAPVEQAQAVGEPDELGFPNPEEREMLVLTNQVRHAPSNQCGDWTAEFGSEARRPLTWNAKGAHGARFTAQHLHDGSCFQHASCCVLEKRADGTVACVGDYIAPCGGPVCLGSDDAECTGGTPTAERYYMFDFSTWSGENLAAGNALASDTICQWLHSDGHRANIYSGHTELGTGYYRGDNCFAHYWVQGFGRGGEPVPRIPAASAIRTAVQPRNASHLYFAANYYDVDMNAAPQRAAVVVDGHCLDLTHVWGDEHNGTYEYHPGAEDIPAGCHRYYFLFVDADAQRVTYPTEGTLGIGIGDTSCPDYDPGPQPLGDCEGGEAQCQEGEEESCYSGEPGTEGVGVCHAGVRVCRNGFWSQCRQQVIPRAEACNGLDDDCDGEIDEDVAGEGDECVVSSSRVLGICEAGVKSCIAGRMLCVSNVEPEPVELCDGRDEDCDGQVDDGLGWTTCGVGACLNRVQNCIAGIEFACVPHEPTPERCTTGGPGVLAVDEDCDGLYDEDCACEDGEIRACYSGSPEELRGACRAGIMRCVDGAWGPCEGEVRPSDEVCDGIDNDCDGSVDEPADLGMQSCGVGACRNVMPVCLRGEIVECQPEPPSEEVCNGIDDDCDGEIDEGCTCPDGSERRCYDGPPLAIGVGACVEGIQLCSGGQWPSECSGQVLPTEEICGDGIDQDCDGEVDEDCGPGSEGGGSPSGADEGDGGGCACSAGGAPGLAWAATGLLLLRRLAGRQGAR